MIHKYLIDFMYALDHKLLQIGKDQSYSEIKAIWRWKFFFKVYATTAVKNKK